MERMDFFARRDEITKERCRLLREKNGYVPGAHREEDSIRNKDKKLDKTKKIHQEKLDLWLDNKFKHYKAVPGCSPPSHDVVKEFIRWCVSSATGRLSEGKQPTVRTVKAWAERFFGGFKESTKTEVPQKDRKEVYDWIKNTLTAEGIVVDQKKQKYNFKRDDFLKVVASIWQADHQKFIPGLTKVLILFALQLYLFTGARVGTFMPSDEDKHYKGLRYEVFNQKWLKNNRGEKYTVFGIGIRDSNKPQFASGQLLLALALAHGALFGIETVSDLEEFDLSNGEIPLEWKESFKTKPIFRNVTADGPQEIPLTNKEFSSYLHQIFDAAGYSEHPTIHCLRRNLAKEVEARYGSAPVSQILAHRDPKTFPDHYQAHCSSIDTVSAVLDEKGETKHIEYFQGYTQFCVPGLPVNLPAHIEESILMLPEMVELRSRIGDLRKCNNQTDLRDAKLRYRNALVRQRRFELKRYQTSWVQARRDQKILNRGKEQPVSVTNDVCIRAQSLIMPEIARIATAMSRTTELSFEEKIMFVKDLQTQCFRDFDVVYLPNESPIHSACPAKACQVIITSLKKSERSTHIHACVRSEKAADFQVSESQMRFCYECMEWCLLSEWRDHCNAHLQSWETQHCEVIIYRHTVIRPGYCPLCLWNAYLPAEERLDYWLKSGNLRQHIEEQHMCRLQWPTTKPVCGCAQEFDNERDLRHHLHDIHGLNKAIWSSPKLPRKRKRAFKTELEAQRSSTELEEERPKRLRFYPHPPPRHEQQPDQIFVPISASLSYVEEHPERYYCSELSDTPSESSRSSAAASYFPAADSSLSSPPTTPGLEVIDPRILKPIELRMGDDCEPYNQATVQLDPPDLSMDELAAKNEPYTCQKLSKRSSKDCAGKEANERPGKALRPDSLISPSNQRPKLRREEYHHMQAESDDKTLSGNQACVSLTRVKPRSQSPLNNLGDLSTRKLRQKLNTREK
ncbi:uncharacterized protein N7515_003872 [Penicillium bovifimosum]|uniref:Uncharacterized protein n=1 Tax=Penicillium bovifimosum TaxID=126998 RepID=A0A9W9H6U7_9EURO|nr:uncharacterized protein N7515_003872 [Penicillium bovifimosum]KAJ5139024.1 hypothetical protein N7515_003872 [Penicillium bovifimosum]